MVTSAFAHSVGLDSQMATGVRRQARGCRALDDAEKMSGGRQAHRLRAKPDPGSPRAAGSVKAILAIDG